MNCCGRIRVKKLEALRDAIGTQLVNLGKKINKLVVIDCDMAKHTRLSNFFTNFPERGYQVGICEQNAISVAAGIASCGDIPLVSSFSAFIATRCWEQIRHSIAYNNTNVKILATHGGLSAAEDGGSHQCLEDFALMNVLPNMVVLVPADPEEARQAITFALEYTGPVYIRIGRDAVDTIMPNHYKFELGKAICLSDGEEVAIISTGEITQEVIKAKELLKEHNLNIKVIHVPCLKPIDFSTLTSLVGDSKYIVTVEEHSIYGGLGAIIATNFLGEITPLKFKSIGMETFGESGKSGELKGKYGLDCIGIAKTILELLV